MEKEMLEKDRKKVEERARGLLHNLAVLFAGQNFGAQFIVLGDYNHAVIRIRNDPPVDIDILPAELTQGTNLRFIKEKFPTTIGWTAATYLAQGDLNLVYIERNLRENVRCFVP